MRRLLTLTLGLLVLAPALLGQSQGQQVPDHPATLQDVPQRQLNLPYTSQKLQQLQQQLAAQKQLSADQARQLGALRQRLNDLSTRQKSTLNRLDVLAQNISSLQAQGHALKLQIADVETRIAALEARIAERQARVDRLTEDVRQLMLSLYRDRSGRELAILSQARSLSDLLVRARYANMLGTQNVQVVETLKAERAALDAQRRQQVVNRDHLATLQSALEAKLADLVRQRGQQNALLAQLKRDTQGQQALQARTQAQQLLTVQTISGLVSNVVGEQNNLAAQRQALIVQEQQRREAELAQLRARQAAIAREQARLAALQRARQAAAQRAAQQAQQDRLAREQNAVQDQQNQLQQQSQQATTELAPLPSTIGNLTFPLPGGRVSSVFGATGPWVVLSGAQNVVSAAAGNVLEVVSYPNTGWVVIVQHTSTVQTVYGGLASVGVSRGEHVAAGQSVGVSGGSPLYGTAAAIFMLYRSGQSVPSGF